MAAHTDPHLANAWGIASSGNGPWWVNANATDFSLVYDGSGNGFPANTPLVVSIPGPAAGVPAQPTGIVFNGTPDFDGAIFLFANQAGTISEWKSGTAAVTKVTTAGANYVGLTMGQLNGANVLYAANFASGKVDVFDSSFNPMPLASATAFQDPMLPTGYAPFNVQNIGGSIFVMFAKVGSTGDEEHGAGLGYVDQFSPAGVLELRLEHGDWMNAPWGIAAAPVIGFGKFSRDILVGQFGSGQIAAFNARTGKFDGLLEDIGGVPITIDGLWGIRFGNGGVGGSPHALFFAAGIQDEMHGLFGTLTFAGQSGQGRDNGNDDKDRD